MGPWAGEAFQLRSGEDNLSVNWLECFAGISKSQQVAEVRRRSRVQLRPNGRLAELNVGRTKGHLHGELADLRFVPDPLDADETEGGFEADPSHSEITGLPPADSPEAELIGDMIAECVTTVHPAVG